MAVMKENAEKTYKRAGGVVRAGTLLGFPLSELPVMNRKACDLYSAKEWLSNSAN